MNAEFVEQFAKAEGNAFVSGNAVGKPQGLLTNANVIMLRKVERHLMAIL